MCWGLSCMCSDFFFYLLHLLLLAIFFLIFFQHFFFIYIKTFYRLGVSSIFSGISPPTFSNDFLVSCSDHSKIISLLRLVLLQTHKTRLRHKDIKSSRSVIGNLVEYVQKFGLSKFVQLCFSHPL